MYQFQKADNAQEVFRAAIETRGLPKEVLAKLGIRHIRSRPNHPQTCGKIESF